MKTYMGIDPGSTGAVAVISSEQVRVKQIPLTANKECDIKEIVSFLDPYFPNITICYIEKAQSMSNQGVKSMFTYGKTYGMLRAMLEIMGVPYQEISPQSWKKHFSLIKKTKADSIAVAMKIFPMLDKSVFFGPRGGKKDGVAEALLIAEFCKRKVR